MLNSIQRAQCLKTISSNALLFLVLDALEAKESLSVVRMADGERQLMEICMNNPAHMPLLPITNPGPDDPKWMTEGWLKNMGLYGIPLGMLRARLDSAASQCNIFCPSITGVVNPEYDLYNMFPARSFYGDIFSFNLWNEDQKADLFQRARHVLCIHRNAHTADSMQLRVQGGLGVKVTWLPLERWQQGEEIIRKAHTSTAPLVLFSGGPSNKWIGPQIATGPRSKVVLDIGNAMDHWTFKHLPVDREQANRFHQQWAANNQQWVSDGLTKDTVSA